MMHLNPDGDLETVAARMVKSIEEIITVEITTATRSVEIDGVSVEEGQVIALINGKLAVSGPALEDVTIQALGKAQASQYELITLFHGESLTAEQANRIVDHIRTAYPSQEIELQDGGQPHYQFIISVE